MTETVFAITLVHKEIGKLSSVVRNLECCN